MCTGKAAGRDHFRAVIDFLAETPILLLFLVAAAGHLVGRIRLRGLSLGIAGVLFAGVAAGAISEKFELPSIVYELGLALFVYALGLTSGPQFLESMRQGGLRIYVFVLMILVATAACVVAVSAIVHLSPGEGAGLYAGVLTNTPALAAIVDALRSNPATATSAQQPVVAYSLAYPVSIAACLIAIIAAQRHWKVDYAREAEESEQGGHTPIVNRTVNITTPMSVAALHDATKGPVLVGRVSQNGQMRVAGFDTELQPGDTASLIGTRPAVEAAARQVGKESHAPLHADRTTLDFRRIFVSNTELAGRTIGSLNLQRDYGALITRVRRGDADLVGTSATRLELGDRVRVVAPPGRMNALTRLFGDSYRRAGEVDITSFSLGIALGLLLGSVEVPMPGGASFSLGFAGGPLLVGLVLGGIGRTGRIVWSLPYAAGVTLRQFGLLLFFAGIGVRAGQSFAATVFSREGALLLLATFAVTLPVALLTLVLGRFWFRLPMASLTGIVAGAFTQPATLAFASEQARSDMPETSYAAVSPVAIFAKILIAQVLLLL